MLVKEKVQTDLTEDWPLHYFEIENIGERKKILQEHIAQSGDSSDLRRAEILERRFAGKRQDDMFFHAWMMILVSQNEKPNFLNRKRKEKEFAEWMRELCITDCERDEVLEKEWEDFAARYLTICATSGSYRAILGIIPMKDVHLARKIRDEILLVTKKIPALYGREEEFEDLYRIMRTVYMRLIENGPDYWEE